MTPHMPKTESPSEKRERLRKQLNDTHTWPCAFTFKFIVPSDGTGDGQLRAIFSEAQEIRNRPSRNGRFTAYTIVANVKSAESVFEHYEAAAEIPGIISL